MQEEVYSEKNLSCHLLFCEEVRNACSDDITQAQKTASETIPFQPRKIYRSFLGGTLSTRVNFTSFHRQ